MDYQWVSMDSHDFGTSEKAVSLIVHSFTKNALHFNLGPLAMAGRRRRQRAALARPGHAISFGSDD